VKLAITCGYKKSLHTIALIDRLNKLGFDLKFCFEVSVLNHRRIMHEYYHLGLEGMFKKFKRRMILRQAKNSELHPEIRYIQKYNKNNDISYRTVKQVCQAYGCNYIKTNDLNQERNIKVLKDHDIDLVIYSGGGILKQEFIQAPKVGVLNAHGGALPYFRGMNAAEWSILYGIKPYVTIHFIDEGIDTGPIIEKQVIEYSQDDCIQDIRGKAVVLGVEMILQFLSTLAENGLILTHQKADEGKQFFRMTPELLKLAQLRLKRGGLKDYES